MSPTIVLERRGGPVLELRRGPFEILLDDHPAGRIERNATVELDVAAGPHTLAVRDGRYRSPVVSLDAADGAPTRLRCSGAIFWPRYLASLFVPDIGLKLVKR